MPLEQRMDKENVVYLHNGVLYSRKNNDVLNFAGKWMELENIILSEVTQNRKTITTCTHSLVDFKHKAKKASLQITIPENLDNNEDSKRDKNGINLHGRKKYKMNLEHGDHERG